MTETVLLVDDDPNVLSALPRTLRGKFDVQTALGPEQGLAAVQSRGPHCRFAVVVADMQMPGMNGVEFLQRLAELAPTTVRIMLTGQADQQTAVDAVNQGNIFRFLTKPCATETLADALQAGMMQHRLVTAERELLAKTLSGSVKLLTDVLAMVKPKAFGKASRVRRLVQQLATRMKLDSVWQLEMAAMLSQVGCVSMPEGVLDRIYRGKPLTPVEEAMFHSHPRLGAELVANIPRLEVVARMIACQNLRFDGSDSPEAELVESAIPLGARILKLALDYDALVSSSKTTEQAMLEIRRRRGWYDPVLVESLAQVLEVEVTYDVLALRLDQLVDGMILDEHVVSTNGDVLITRGQEVTTTTRQRLMHYAQAVRAIQEPIKVLVPLAPLAPESQNQGKHQPPAGQEAVPDPEPAG